MADAVYSARNSVYALTAGAKTVLNIIAGANQPVEIDELAISFDGVTATAVPATVELCQSTQATAGTPGASPPAIVQSTGRTIAAQFTVAHNYTAEPTALTVIRQWFIPVFNGTFDLPITPDQEPDSDLSGGTIKALALRVNVAAAVNCLAFAKIGIGG